MLLNEIANPNATENEGKTAVLHHVESYNSKETRFQGTAKHVSEFLSDLRSFGGDLWRRDKYPRNIFHYIINAGLSPKFVFQTDDAFCEENVNQSTHRGWTPLHLEVSMRRVIGCGGCWNTVRQQMFKWHMETRHFMWPST